MATHACYQFSGMNEAGKRLVALVLSFFFSLVPALTLAAESETVPAPPAFDLKDIGSAMSREKKVLAVNAGGILLITAWGVANWDYGDRSPHAMDERWFSRNTKVGGADKLGHFQFNYTLTHGLSYLYEHWGYEQERAAFWGGISSFGLMGFMEAGDSFSDYGFSHEDFLMNSLGSLVGYYFYLHPEISSKIDFRVEYDFDFSKADFFTDYENQKYLLAVKLAGFDFIENELFKYLELHLGYYTRGYDDNPPIDREQNLYCGIGINLSRVFEKMSCKKTAKVLQYIQIPHTYLTVEEDMN